LVVRLGGFLAATINGGARICALDEMQSKTQAGSFPALAEKYSSF